jgi:penicillin-binding protein 1A
VFRVWHFSLSEVTMKGTFRFITIHSIKNKQVVFWSVITLLCFFALLLIFYILVRCQVFGPVPSSTDLESIENYNASEILAKDGEQLGKYFLYDRSSITLEEIPHTVTNALIATEDIRFYNHRGIDLRSLGRVIVKGIILRQRDAGGGSTITLQLAKNLFPRNASNLFRLVADKFREAIIARRLEKVYSKEDIMVLYLNTVSFGDNVYGISAASHRFFNKPPMDLYQEEAAVLIGMLKATQTYNPRMNPDRSLLRRNTVINQMRVYNYISDQDADSLIVLPLSLDYKPVSHIHGPAPYFREQLRQDLAAWLAAYNVLNLTTYNLYTDGLIIHTSIDYQLQILAEEAMQQRLTLLQQEVDRHYHRVSRRRVEHLIDQLMLRSEKYQNIRNQGLSETAAKEAFMQERELIFFNGSEEVLTTMSLMDSIFNAQKILHGAIISIEPATGLVRTWVGGIHYRFFQFDNTLSRRQAGSSFKPFIYAAALEAGVNPCDYISNEPIVYEDLGGWSPSNANGNYEGYYSLKGAITHSVNTSTIRILESTGYEPLLGILQQSGLPHDVPRLPSLALGAIETNLLDLTTAYGMFANRGVVIPHSYLLRIEDSEGNILFDRNPPEASEQVITERTASMMTDMMKNVTMNGTAYSVGQRMSGISEVAGKTGTTQNNADGWFVGYTPGLITGVWVGLENPSFASIYPLPFGAPRSAAALWTDFMLAAGKDESIQTYSFGKFDELPQEIKDALDCPDYLPELPRASWFERLFERLDTQKEEPSDTMEEKPKRKSIFRRILDEIF